MRGAIGLIAALGLLFGAQANAQGAPAATSAVAPQPSTGAGPRSFGFARFVTRVPSGQLWLSPHFGVLCLIGQKVAWKGAQQQNMKTAEFTNIFTTEMKAAGFKVDGGDDNLFEPSDANSDIEIGGILTNVGVDYCIPRQGVIGTDHVVNGSGFVEIQWQVYSTIQRTLLAKIDTRGSVQSRNLPAGGPDALLAGAFRDDVRNLAASAAFRQAVSGPPPQVGGGAKPALQGAIPLAGSLAAGSRPISNAVASVVMIRAGGSMGSGFLVSSDGLLITDQHVVGDAKLVSVRWSDGAETVGEVVRSNKVRDVALIRTDARGRGPLSLRRDPPRAGDTVFAIGAPLDSALQSTVTRGIVSAIRTVEGQHLIQSDVFINHGSSGGPLLDEKGAVVGISESIYRPNGEAESINFFTPIGEALDSLSAEPR